MRFLMLTTFYPPYSFGGDAAYIFRLAGELGRRGHDVHVAHCGDAFNLLRAAGPQEPAIGQPGVTVHTLRSGVGLLSPLLTQQTGRGFFKRGPIRELVERERFDVLHFHNMSLIGLDVIDVGDAVRLYTTHEHWLVCPTHVLWKYNREVCTERSCFTCQLVSRRPPQWWRYTDFADRHLSRVDRFLCPSRFTLEKHREYGFRGPMTHLPYFLPRPTDATGPRPHQAPYALFVGRLEKIKGVQNLLRVFGRYRNIDLVIVGNGTFERALKDQAQGLDHVHFLGRMGYDELRAWYRHATAVVIPSICFEVFGIVALEAFAHDTPVLVTAFGALPEVVQESGGGYVYREDEELASMLETLRAHPDLRDELGRRGHEA
ncbi:MAG: glycosyltransferase, partial [Acidobacteria bacterium]|nr:glycosyltransferase [Acidobacteriota bacterium]